MILKQQNVKSVTDASIWVKFISKNSQILEIEHSLLNSPIFIPRYGFNFRSTDLADKAYSKVSGSVCKQTEIKKSVIEPF